MKKKDIMLIIMLLCCILLCACNDNREKTEIVSDGGAKEDMTEESAEMDRAAKGYDLPISDSERKKAEDGSFQYLENKFWMMGFQIYRNISTVLGIVE